jgi:hypothetical protein
VGVHQACDSAAAIAREALRLDLKREEGSYVDSRVETPRLGCRLTGRGAFAAIPDSAGPVDAMDVAFKRHGWRNDLRYGADGPDGADIGVRRLDQLCLVLGQWEGGDDEDTIQRPTTEEESRYDITIECARELAPNRDAGVPDSIWRVASSAGLDSGYAISLSLQYPPYLDGDFDGDGVSDAAVLIENRSSGKLGVAIVHRGTPRVSILGAGAAGDGPDDLSWIDGWDVFRKDATMSMTIPGRPSAQLNADALWVGRRDSVSAFYLWTGSGYKWESHRR